MRLWHYQLLPYLPDAQFKGQLRELVAIMHDLRDKGKTNHVLINIVQEFTPRNLCAYFFEYEKEYLRRYNKRINHLIISEFTAFCGETKLYTDPFQGWHSRAYLRMNMANLYEKFVYGRGKSRITDEEWQRLLDGYRDITGEDYLI